MRKETAEEGFQSVLRGCHKRHRALVWSGQSLNRRQEQTSLFQNEPCAVTFETRQLGE